MFSKSGNWKIDSFDGAILEIDLITKNTKIYMNNSLEKVKITSLIN